MLHHLTRYLLQYGQVCVPFAGALRLVQRPAALNVADEILQPPSYAVELQPAESVSGHQLTFLHNVTGKQEGEIEKELQSFGIEMQRQIAAGGFHWEGLGTIKDDRQTLTVNLLAMQPVAAEKAVRPKTVHNVLVGDRELTSVQAMEKAAYALPSEKKRSVSVIIGWALLLLAVLAVAVLLYLGKFTVAATGSRLSPTGWTINTHH